jgi:transposase-like protein
MSAELQNPIFTDEAAARAALEAIVWPHGRVCPHCGNVDQERIAKAQGKSVRPGLWYCAACNGQFTATVGTVFERSKIPLTKWWLAMHLLGSSKKGISSHQLHRSLGVTYKTAWFMTHRIREAMRIGGLAPMGGAGSIVEIDETFIGRKPGMPIKRGTNHKHVVLTLVERGGSVRSFHVDGVKKDDVLPIIRANLDRETHVMTDEAARYAQLGTEFAKHDAIDHSREEYGYTDRKTGVKVNTNTIEGYCSIFKRGMKGVEDAERTTRIAAGITGKRLTYRRTNGQMDA